MEEKNQQDHFNNPVVVVLFLALVAIGGYFLFSKNQDEPQITQNVDQDSQQEQIDALKKQVEDLKNQKPETITKEIPVKSGTDLSSIVKYWRPRVAYVECAWRYEDTNEIYLEASGSAMAFREGSNEIHLLTNEHVLVDEEGYTATSCLAKIPGDQKIYSFTKWDGSMYHTLDGNDWGYLKITDASPYLRSIVDQDLNSCKSKANTGDSVVILGYPSYGDGFNDITATEGIISGYQDPYYTTSAKIEHGNSGGIAVLVKDSCYIGIPTGVKVGAFESLGRIFDVRNIFRQ